MTDHGNYSGVVDIARNGIDLAIRQRDELYRLRQQLSAARLALVQYGAHDHMCAVLDFTEDGVHAPCNCGYEAAIKAAEQTAGPSPSQEGASNA